MSKLYLLTFIIFFSTNSYSQFQGNVWCFGDSVMMTFDQANNFSFSGCNLHTYESAASIADSAGNLELYIGIHTYLGNPPQLAMVYNKFQQIIPGADSLYTNFSAAGGLMILPKPGSTSNYIVLHTACFVGGSLYFLFYTEVDAMGNGGAGSTISKNNLLSVPNDSLCDGVTAVRHGNGKDWWIVAHSLKTNLFYYFLLSSNGIVYHHSQSIGSLHFNNTWAGPGVGSGLMKFSPQGNKFACVDLSGIADLFDFDRCDGLLSNWVNLDSNGAPYLSCAFSPYASILYISSDSRLYQYDLASPNYSRYSVYHNVDPDLSFGHMLLAPDGKIYISNWFIGVGDDTVNTHLSMINFPESLYSACLFEPHAGPLYVGRGRRTQGSMPNMPNFNLGPMIGSICDSLFTDVTELKQKNKLIAFPNPTHDKLNINFNGATKKWNKIIVKSVLGEELFSVKNNSAIDLSRIPSSVYLLELHDGASVYYLKVCKE